LSCYKSTAIFDAEIIVPDAAGRPDFDALQARWLLTNEGLIRKKEAENPAQLYVFDLLHQGVHDLTGCKLTDRKQMLTATLIEKENVREVLSCDDGVALHHACKEQRLEGIVAKKSDSKYRPGQRTKDWVKVKFTENGVFTVVGYRKDDGFLVAEQRGKELVPVGFVQYGFSDTSYRKMVTSLKTVNRGSSDRLIRYEPWVKINVEFMTRTKKGQLRFPVFKSFAQG
jgi:bifunctional non-homologous end joining protein LigD